MLLIVVVGWDEAWQAWEIGERSGTSSWSPKVYPYKFVVLLAAALLILQGVSECLKAL